jgi:hypothetical protein
MHKPGIQCYCNFCGTPLQFEISRAGEAVNCLNCCMETVLFIPGLEAPYPGEQYVVEARDIRWGTNQFGVRQLQGTVHNKSAKHLDWIRVEFILYGQQGLPVGSTSDCLTGVSPGKVWDFQASVAQGDAVKASAPLLTCEYGRIATAQPAASPNGPVRLNGAPPERSR